MIDPDGIQIQDGNLPSNIKLDMKEIPPCDINCYCLEDDKEYDHYLKDIEKYVRRSFEYRKFISYIRDYMQMNQCAFLANVTNTETFDIKIQMHHYPFSLYDIADIVAKKRSYYKESMDLEMTAKEVMELHYKLIIGLISLSETVHELSHSSRLFIPVDRVLGRYKIFVEYYRPFIDPKLLEILDRIEKYSEEEQSKILDTTILNENKISYEITDPGYMIPDVSKVNVAMIEQINNIKNNNYILPSIEDKQLVEERKVICPISFDYSLLEK